jgi:hypothetical protein
MADTELRKQIKILLQPEDHDRLRIAAAFRRQPMAEFCRHVVLVEVNRLTQGVGLPAAAVAAGKDNSRLPKGVYDHDDDQTAGLTLVEEAGFRNFRDGV